MENSYYHNFEWAESSKLKLPVEIILTNLTDRGFDLGLFADGEGLRNE